MSDVNDEVRPELLTFSCKEAYVYKAPPPSTVGHRAELWDVDNPMQVRLFFVCRNVAQRASDDEKGGYAGGGMQRGNIRGRMLGQADRQRIR